MSIYVNQEKIRGGLHLMSYSRLFEEKNLAFTAMEGFIGIDKFGLLLGYSHFYPYPPDVVSRHRISFQPHWIDILGNSLYFNEDEKNKMRFVENDASIDKKYVFNVDYFTGLSIKNHIQIGKTYFINIGEDKDTNEKVLTLLIRSKDNYFRSFVFTDKWRKISPFVFDPRFLRSVYFTEQEDLILPMNSYLGCINEKQYIGFSKEKVLEYIGENI